MFNVEKQLYIEAPYKGVAVYAFGQSYTANSGYEIVESVRYEAKNYKRAELGGASFYSREIYRRLSTDNGKTWRILGDVYREDPLDKKEEHPHPPGHYLDPDNQLLLSVFLTKKYDVDKGGESFSDEGITHKKCLYYSISRDRGRTWTEPRVIIHKGSEYDEIHWGPGLFYGKNGSGGASLGAAHKLDKKTIVFPITVNLEDGKRMQTVMLRATWNNNYSDLEWEFGQFVSVSLDKSSQGCCEPMPAYLDDGRIFMSLRCCGDRENKTFPSLKFWVISDDGGRTFSAPQPLTYEDGSMVWSPSSIAGIIRSSLNGKYYWIGNILDRPTYSSYPRYPLCIAELIPEKGHLLKNTVTVIDTAGKDAPERRRYTNFGFYQERGSGDIILTLPEQPKISWEDFTSDCYGYRLKLL